MNNKIGILTYPKYLHIYIFLFAFAFLAKAQSANSSSIYKTQAPLYFHYVYKPNSAQGIALSKYKPKSQNK